MHKHVGAALRPLCCHWMSQDVAFGDGVVSEVMLAMELVRVFHEAQLTCDSLAETCSSQAWGETQEGHRQGKSHSLTELVQQTTPPTGRLILLRAWGGSSPRHRQGDWSVYIVSAMQKVADDKVVKAKKVGTKGKKEDGPAQNGEAKTNEVPGDQVGGVSGEKKPNDNLPSLFVHCCPL